MCQTFSIWTGFCLVSRDVLMEPEQFTCLKAIKKEGKRVGDFLHPAHLHKIERRCRRWCFIPGAREISGAWLQPHSLSVCYLRGQFLSCLASPCQYNKHSSEAKEQLRRKEKGLVVCSRQHNSPRLGKGLISKLLHRRQKRNKVYLQCPSLQFSKH